jgi:hypothetical protein
MHNATGVVVADKIRPQAIPTAAGSSVEQASYTYTTNDPNAPGVPHNSLTRVVFAHAPDYSWVTGELWYVPSKNCWRIHYASAREDEKFGGTLTLVNPGTMTDFRIGQVVYIEGAPLAPVGASSGPLYQVNKVMEVATP